MAVRRRAVIAFAVLALGLLAPERAPARQRPPRKHSHLIGNRHFEAWWWVFAQRAYPLGYIPEGAKDRALRQIENTKPNPLPSPAAPSPSAAVAGDAWVNIGPAPINGGQVAATGNTRPMSGRVGAVAVDPIDPSHWLIGAARGGVWETRDAGATWSPMTDAQASLAMGAIAYAPSDPRTIYAGSGEAVFSADAYAGRGLLKSTDGASPGRSSPRPPLQETPSAISRCTRRTPTSCLPPSPSGRRDGAARSSLPLFHAQGGCTPPS